MSSNREAGMENFALLLKRLVDSNKEMILTLESHLQAALLFGLDEEEIRKLQKPLKDLCDSTRSAEDMVRRIRSSQF
jgi:hypothetical protein